MKIVAGIDNGTQSTKVLLYDYENKTVVATESASHDLLSEADGTREQKAEWWIGALKNCFEKLPVDLKSGIEAIGVSGQQHGFVPVDKNGTVLRNVKLWCDTATVPEADAITEEFGGKADLLDKAGNLVLTGYTAPKILWFKKNFPGQYAKMAKILLPHDYLNYYLTGDYWMEYGDASGTGFLNIRSKSWNREILNIIDPKQDWDKVLPRLIEADEIGGTVSSKAAAEFGIPAGIPVSSGGGDNMMSAIGAGVVSEGTLAVSMGTSGTMYGYSESPVIDPGERLAAFCSSSGGYLPLLCTMNCTVATELYRKMYGLGVKEMDAIADESVPGAEGLLTIPFFNGERTPNLPNGKGCLVGMNGTNVTQANILRSSMESALYGLKMGLEAFSEQGFKASQVILTGGGAKSAVWKQYAADAFNLPVQLPVIEETAALGGALQALWALKKSAGKSISLADLYNQVVPESETPVVNPVKENVPAYESSYTEYKKYVSTLENIFR